MGKRNKFCPYKKFCREECYGSQPCDFALAFDKLARKLEWWKGKSAALETRLKQAEKTTMEPRVSGDYVFTPCQNAFNGKTSWWISKKNCTVALYCFTAETGEEVDAQLAGLGARAYIEMYKNRTGVEHLVEQMIQHLPREPRSYEVNDDPGFWTNGTDILCPSEVECEAVADFIEDVLREESTMTVHTGYYDPDEDDRSGERDHCTGFHYIDFD